MERLNEMVEKKGVLVAGFDPDMDKVWKITAMEMPNFSFDYIDAVKDEVVAIKINFAFFLDYGELELFWDVAKKAKSEGLFVIADIEASGDENTAKKYAENFLNKCSPIDAITVSPYFGTDCVKPCIDIAKENGKAVFVSVKTSNGSSADIQDLELKDGRKLYQQVAELVKEWGEYAKTDEDEKYSLVGAVVGATHPEEAKLLREMMPNTFFLVPGYGAQGATADDIVVNFDNNGGGAIVNSSRGLMFAYEKEGIRPDKWKEATKRAAKRSRKELCGAVNSYVKNKKTKECRNQEVASSF